MGYIVENVEFRIPLRQFVEIEYKLIHRQQFSEADCELVYTFTKDVPCGFKIDVNVVNAFTCPFVSVTLVDRDGYFVTGVDGPSLVYEYQLEHYAGLIFNVKIRPDLD